MGNAFCCFCSPSEGQNQIPSNIMPDNLSKLQSMDDFKELIDYIDVFLRKKDRVQTKQEETTAPSTSVAQAEQEETTEPNSLVNSFINSGRELTEKFSTGLNRRFWKRCLLSALDSRTAKILAEVLKEAKSIPCAGMAFSIIAFLLERTEQVSSNKEKCFRLLGYMYNLAKHMKDLDIHIEGERVKLDDILRFIVKATVICAQQMEPNRFCRFVCASLDYDDLQDLENQLQQSHEDLKFDALIEILNRIPKVPDHSQRIYPHHAVDIKEAENKVIGLLELTDSAPRVVVVYGVGGIGKTTLATAVFSRLDLKTYNHCRVVMQQDCTDRDLKKMQEQILRDILKENLKLNNWTEGQENLLKAFRKSSEPVFLFIDNALRKTDLEKLLPVEQLSLPKGSRILVTTRNRNEAEISNIKVFSYRVDSLSEQGAKRLLCHHALGDASGSFDSAVNIDGLLQLCGGIPLVLKLVGSRLRTEIKRADGNIASECNRILEYFEKWKQGGLEGEESERIVDFVYEHLRLQSSKEAFLDIVFFYHDWERSKVADIVGEMELRDLEAAALVTSSEEEELTRFSTWSKAFKIVKKTVVKMHDIVRARGRKLSGGTRIMKRESLSTLQTNDNIDEECEDLELMMRRRSWVKRSS